MARSNKRIIAVPVTPEQDAFLEERARLQFGSKPGMIKVLINREMERLKPPIFRMESLPK